MSVRRKLWLVGLSHHSAPVEVREKLAFENGAVSAAIRKLLDLPGIEEGALVSTCNRVEVVACADGETSKARPIGEFLARERGLAPSRFADHLYVHEDREAVRHLFRVASSLDSM
ncbi:MAG: glutamyl-tRNA reductase, partial [Candidatus Binatia bacterium]